jgi:ankyrin repeat protein
MKSLLTKMASGIIFFLLGSLFEMGLVRGIALAFISGFSFPALAECEKQPTAQMSMHSLLEAIKCGHTDEVEEHIKAGTNLNDYDHEDWTPLMVAVANRNLWIADMLTKHGADVNFKVKAEHDETVLFLATRVNSTKGIEFLISKGADVNTRNRDGETPLFMLRHYDRIGTARLLISIGADVNARNRQGVSVLSHYRSRRDAELVNLLLSHGAAE